MSPEQLSHTESANPVEFKELSDEELLEDIRRNPNLAWIETMVTDNLRELVGDEFFTEANKAKLDKHLAGNAREIIKRLHLDPLTGLLNKEGFQNETEKLMRTAESNGLSLVIGRCDLDGFKGVNDNLGHHEGDDVLRRFAKLLEELMRQGDPKARESGDEFTFAIMAPEIVAKIIAKRLGTAAPSASPHSPVSTSMGFAIMRPGDSFQSLTRRAELALQWSKAQGKNRATVMYEVDQTPKALQFTNPEQANSNSSFSVYSTAIGKPPERHDRVR